MNKEERINQLLLYKGQTVTTTVEDVDVTASENNSEYYRVIKKVNQKVNDHYFYFVIIECKYCGELKKIYSSDWKNQKVRRCKNCLSLQKRDAFIGYENNTYKVLSVNTDRSNNNGRHLYYNVKCKNCGATLVVRKDNILEDTKNKKCVKCAGNHVGPTPEPLYNISYNRYKQNAIARNLSFELSKNEFKEIVSKNCAYCGKVPSEIQSLKRYNHTGHPIYMNGIDRIDSNKGYTINNCVPCCEMCNRMKLNYTKKQFLDHVEQIYLYHKSLTTIPNGSTSQANGDGSGESPEKENDIV